ncbi:hypothetical protein [Streptomyces sp. NPDC088789]|uniref:hypothetical protein n=1 Tax=Streptomyces sp. NPDC088789 TaxID=3365899 RepID=UPI00381FCD95
MLRDDLAEKARAVGRLVDELGQDKGPNALLRLQARLDFQKEVEVWAAEDGADYRANM